jgi:hypothetical protein
MAASNQNSFAELGAYSRAAKFLTVVRERLEDMPEISEFRWDGV